MIVSEAMREANRQNAQHSTGPRTEAGKEASSRNAVRHGLTAEKPVDAAEAREHEKRVAAFRDLFAPADEWQGWLVEQLAGATLRLTRIERAEMGLRADAALRAEKVWDADRALEADRVGATLHRHPARAVATLRRTPQGCDWLIDRWLALATAAKAAGNRGWSPEQAELARDLLGTPPECRPGPIGADGRPDGIADSPVALALEEVADLQAIRADAAEADESARLLVVAGLADGPACGLANLRRYERASARRLEWVKAQMDEAGLRPRVPSPSPSQPPSRPQPPGPRPAAPADPAAPSAATPGPQPDRRNEPAPARFPGGEVAVSAAPAAPEARPKRPDLAKFHRRNRRSA